MKKFVSIQEMVTVVREKISPIPDIAVILGTGLGLMTHEVKNADSLPYREIPGYPQPTVVGHSGEFIRGNLGHTPILFASGRFHYYEGHSLETVTLPIFLFHALGIKTLIITNSAGSVRKSSPPGTLMAITGHMDCTFRESPTKPKIYHDEKYHDPELLQLAKKIAEKLTIPLKNGVYAWTLGPSYETPAEIEMIRELGGDAVGMSTVPEIRAAGELGLRVLGISCLTNYAAGITDKPLTHGEVIETAASVEKDFSCLVKEICMAMKK